MPELPEVETVRRGLEPVLEGARIVAAEIRRETLRFPLPHGLGDIITGQYITSVSRRAKYLLVGLESGQVLISHLGMSGSWRIEEQGRNPPDRRAGEGFAYARSKNTAHDHFIMQVARDEGVFDIVYNDPRRFGFLLLGKSLDLAAHPLLCKLGIEPTGNVLSGNFLQKAFAGKSTSLKAALLDQRIIAGLGNIYVCEALWRARLSPLRKAFTLAANEKQAQIYVAELAKAICTVIAEAIAAGGSHLRDYVQADGSLGYFQHSFSVYGREGSPCPHCGASVRRLVQAGRSTFYCEQCQI